MTWHEQFKRHVLAKDYAAAVAMLRAPAPETSPLSGSAEGVAAQVEREGSRDEQNLSNERGEP